MLETFNLDWSSIEAKVRHHCTMNAECLYFLPGLSATNLMTAHPFTGTATVFLRGGSTRLNFDGSVRGL